MRFPTMWHVRPAKPQISLRIFAVWSEPLLVAWVFSNCKATGWTPFGVSKLKRRLHRLVWVYTCQNATLLEILCHGSVLHFVLEYFANFCFLIYFRWWRLMASSTWQETCIIYEANSAEKVRNILSYMRQAVLPQNSAGKTYDVHTGEKPFACNMKMVYTERKSQSSPDYTLKWFTAIIRKCTI